jgi:hypothetical protein
MFQTNTDLRIPRSAGSGMIHPDEPGCLSRSARFIISKLVSFLFPLQLIRAKPPAREVVSHFAFPLGTRDYARTSEQAVVYFVRCLCQCCRRCKWHIMPFSWFTKEEGSYCFPEQEVSLVLVSRLAHIHVQRQLISPINNSIRGKKRIRRTGNVRFRAFYLTINRMQWENAQSTSSSHCWLLFHLVL